MAFGDLKGTLTGSGASIGASNSIAGSVVVAHGDLVFAVLGEQTALTATTASDNLGNTYAATNAGIDAGTSTGRAYWARVTVPGTLTSVAVVATASADDWAGSAVVIEGPFPASPLDANPANASDAVSPFTCPATGVLAQAREVVIAWGASATGTAWAATSPNLLGLNTASATNIQATIGYQLVNATTSIAPAFTAGANPTDDTLGVSSFKAPAQTTALWFNMLGRVGAVAAALAVPTQPTTFAVPANPAAPAWGWQGQPPVAPKVAQAVHTQPFVPFNTPQVAAAAPQGWQSIASSAPARAVINNSALTFVVPPFDVPRGWQSRLSTAPPLALAVATQPFVPLNTTQVTPAAPSGWQGATNAAARVAVAVPSQASGFAVPANPDNNVTSKGWQQPLSGAPKLASAVPTQPSFTIAPADVPRGWQAQLSGAVKIAAAIPTQPVLRLDVTQAAATQPVWWSPQATLAAKTAQAVPSQASGFAVPPNPDNNTTSKGWQQPLSKAVPVARASQDQPVLPFVTAVTVAPLALVQDAGVPSALPVYYQALFHPLRPIPAPPNSITGMGWYQALATVAPSAPAVPTQPVWIPTAFPTFTVQWLQPLSGAPLVAKASPGWTFVPFNTTQVIAAPPRGWYQALSPAPPVAKTVQTQAFVPFNTAQIVVTPPSGWYQPLSVAVAGARAVNSQASVPLLAPQVQSLGWYQPLSAAAKAAAPNHTQPAWTPVAFPTFTVEWVQPLSVAVSAAKASRDPASLYLPRVIAAASGASFVSQWLQPLSVAVRYVPSGRDGFLAGPIYGLVPAPTPPSGELRFLTVDGALISPIVTVPSTAPATSIASVSPGYVDVPEVTYNLLTTKGVDDG